MLQLGVRYLLIANLLFFGFTALATVPDSSSLTSKWKMEQDAQFSSMSLELRESLKGKLVIFVAGFWNEGTTPFLRYFGAGLEAAQEDLQMTAIRFYPKSYSFKGNAEELSKLVVDSYEQYHKPIILIGHSKGGLECLYVALKHPDLILNGIIERMVLLQAAIHGTQLLENSENWLVWFSKKTISRLFEGLSVLEPQGAKEIIEEAFTSFKNYFETTFQKESEEFQVNWKKVHNCIYHAPTYAEHTSRTVLTQSCHFWLGDLRAHGQNDGLLRIADQQYAGIGVVLDTVESDHTSLVLTRGIDDSDECIGSFRLLHSLYGSVNSACQRVGISLPTASVVQAGDTFGNLLGGHSKAIQKAYFTALFGHIYGDEARGLILTE